MKLFYIPGACSLAPHIILEEIGLPYHLERVDLKSKKTEHGDDFLAINGKGYVPALMLDSGRILTECTVVSQYLAGLKPEANLLPVSGEAHYVVLEWMSFIATELHKSFASMFNPAQSADWKSAVVHSLTQRLDWLVTQLADRDFLVGEHFTIADAYLFTILNWSNILEFSLERWPAIRAYLASVAHRPATIAAMKAEGLLSIWRGQMAD